MIQNYASNGTISSFSVNRSLSRTQVIKEITKVVKMSKNHILGIINALITKFSNAMTERLNGKIQEIKTVGRGYNF